MLRKTAGINLTQILLYTQKNGLYSSEGYLIPLYFFIQP